jgi:hypothetical protein
MDRVASSLDPGQFILFRIWPEFITACMNWKTSSIDPNQSIWGRQEYTAYQVAISVDPGQFILFKIWPEFISAVYKLKYYRNL